MTSSKRMIAYILEIVIGACLTICGVVGLVDAFWSGMGTALIVVGALQLIRLVRYKASETYREEVDVKVHDERNKYIGMKAWSWAGYIFVLIAAVATIVLKIAGHDKLMFMASGSVCLILVLYWLAYLVLSRKY